MSEMVVPDGWEIKRLGEYVKLQGGNAFKSSEFQDIGVPIVRISNIKGGVVDLSDVVCYQRSSEFNNFSLQKGDVLLAMSGATTGKIGLYKYSAEAYLNQRVGRFLNKSSESIDIRFLYQLVQTQKFTKNVLIDAIGGAQPNISSSQVEGIMYAFPPLPEQQKIASILSSMDSYIEEKQRKLEQTQSLKKSLMQDLLTGKVRVTVH
jgi:type I restriction enzyme, S subunit